MMTVAQYRLLPEREDVIQELGLGKLITSPRPKMKHAKVQLRLVELLQPFARHLGIVATEVAFRALPEYDLRGADVAFVSQARWDNTSDEDNLRGSPELVIEVLSPSNTRAEMREKAALCLLTGTEEFWVVDTKRGLALFLSDWWSLPTWKAVPAFEERRAEARRAGGKPCPTSDGLHAGCKLQIFARQ